MNSITRGAAAVLMVVLAVGTVYRSLERNAPSSDQATPAGEPAPGLLYGRVTTYDGTTYEGRLRWGGGEEAFWDHYFNGTKDENPWASRLPAEYITEPRRPLKVLGFDIPRGERQIDLSRPFMVRFGDIARIDAIGDGVWAFLESGIAFDPDVRVTLKSGTVVDLDRLEASDFDDGVRVWDDQQGIVDLGPGRIRNIEFFAPIQQPDAPERLYGTVRTRHGSFTGFIQWDREEALGRDWLAGHSAEGDVRLRFDDIRSIARHSRASTRVTLRNGREIVLSGIRTTGQDHRGIYVDDPRYGRVLVSWDAFEHLQFSPGGSSPAYTDFAAGHALTGSVTTRTGRRIAGRLVYDLDERETTETLDAPSQGVDYTLPFGRITSVVLPAHGAPALVTLQSGEVLRLERAGDLGAGNAGVLVFGSSDAQPEHVPWSEVERVDFDNSAATTSSSGKR